MRGTAPSVAGICEHGGGDYRVVIFTVNENFVMLERFLLNQLNPKSFAFEQGIRIPRAGWPTGLEPATTRITIWGSTIELRPPSLPGNKIKIRISFCKQRTRLSRRLQ